MKRKNGLKCQERHMLNSLFQLKPWLWSKFEQNFEKRVFCQYFGHFPIVKCPFLQCRVAKAEMTHAMAHGDFFASYRSNKKT